MSPHVKVSGGRCSRGSLRGHGREQANGRPHIWFIAFKNVKILGKLIPKHYELIQDHMVKRKCLGDWGTQELPHRICYWGEAYFGEKVLAKISRMHQTQRTLILDHKSSVAQGDRFTRKEEIMSLWKWSSSSKVRAMEVLHLPEGRPPVTLFLVASVLLLLLRVEYWTSCHSLSVGICFFCECLVPKSIIPL